MSFSDNFHTGPARGRVDVFLKNKMTEIVALNEILAMAIMGTMTGLAAFGVIRKNGSRPGQLGRVSLRELVSEFGNSSQKTAFSRPSRSHFRPNLMPPSDRLDRPRDLEAIRVLNSLL